MKDIYEIETAVVHWYTSEQ